MMLLKMMMNSDCLSKLRPPRGLLEPWWYDTNRGKLLICPSELPCNPTSSHLVAKQQELANEIMNFVLQNLSFILQRVLSHAVKSYNMRPMALLPL
jgi:hypothetical protein